MPRLKQGSYLDVEILRVEIDVEALFVVLTHMKQLDLHLDLLGQLEQGLLLLDVEPSMVLPDDGLEKVAADLVTGGRDLV